MFHLPPNVKMRGITWSDGRKLIQLDELRCPLKDYSDGCFRDVLSISKSCKLKKPLMLEGNLKIMLSSTSFQVDVESAIYSRA